MAAPQGDVALLQDPVAQALLNSREPARLAYSWTGGSPRVRIALTPEWVSIIDFEQRFPSAIARKLAAASSSPRA
jgi:hypothetical protein